MATIKGYKIDFTNNTVSMNYKFAKASQEYGTPEYKLLNAILTDHPTMTPVVKSGRVQIKPNVNKRFTYENMLKHIKCYKNADELVEQFELVKELSKPLASPYKYVCDWFIAQFPEYKDCKATLELCKKEVSLVAIPNTELYQQRLFA